MSIWSAKLGFAVGHLFSLRQQYYYVVYFLSLISAGFFSDVELHAGQSRLQSNEGNTVQYCSNDAIM